MPEMLAPRVSYHLTQTIRDALLLGGTEEIGHVIDLIQDDDEFPSSLRSGLEAIMYFRRYYGQGGELAPSDAEGQDRRIEMDVHWSRELLHALDFYTASLDAKLA